MVWSYTARSRPPGHEQCAGRGIRQYISYREPPARSRAILRFCRRQFRFQRSHLLQKLVGALRLLRVDLAYGEANMDHHIIALPCLGNKNQGYLADNPAELHAGRAHLTDRLNLKNLSWYREAHGRPLPNSVQHSPL